MAVLVGKQAPDFKAQAVMPDGSFQELKLSDHRGKYVLLYFYPLDFTFVCPSEIIAFDNKIDQFKERNVELLGVSVDSHFSHHAWRNTSRDDGGIGAIKYPLIADLTKSIARDYDVLTGDGAVAFRGLFLIDKEGVSCATRSSTTCRSAGTSTRRSAWSTRCSSTSNTARSARRTGRRARKA